MVRPFDPRLAALVTAAVIVAACVRLRGFGCDDSAQCDLAGVAGVCQATGYCSYPDLGCPPTNQRYEDQAGDGLASLCVDADGISGTAGSETGSGSDVCEQYCLEFIAACRGAEAYLTYASSDECIAHCQQWPIGTPGSSNEDSQQCRLSWALQAKAAGVDGSGPECTHASRSGGDRCVSGFSPCDEYCTEVGSCPQAPDDCLGQCGKWYPGNPDDDFGDSANCRLTFAARGDCINAASNSPACSLP